MKSMKRIYREKEAFWCRFVFPLVLAVYPLLLINQGIDVSDSTYSLSNFLYFERMEGMWVISTYLSNLFGWILTGLPFGKTLLGMNLYTGLLVSATVLMVYHLLRKWMPAWIVFVGEWVAIGFLWIPTTILYNYLSYFFQALGALLLYKGLVEEKKRYLGAAGVILGLNVFVRIPNVTQAALIVGLWYYLGSMKQPLEAILKKTGICVAGYGAGVLLPLLAVLKQYGASGFWEALTGLGAIRATDGTYSLLAMVQAVLAAYGRSLKWVLLFGLAIGMGMAMFAFWKGRLEREKKLLYGLGIAVLLRFLWGRGMFSFRYYEDYTSMYEWGMMGLYLAWGCALYLFFSGRTSREEKLWGCLGMVILAVTPLGSNNYTYQNLNNLFLTAPVTLYTLVKIYRYRKGEGLLSGLRFPAKAMVAVLGAMILLQSTGFHFGFVFRDGMDGSRRSYEVAELPSVRGMCTTKENAQALQALYSYVKEEGLVGQPVLLYGDCPGLAYLFEMPFVISTAWPDLDSYSAIAFAEELEELEGRGELPPVILRDTGNENGQRPQKKEALLQWMKEKEYRQTFSGAGYELYEKP